MTLLSRTPDQKTHGIFDDEIYSAPSGNKKGRDMFEKKQKISSTKNGDYFGNQWDRQLNILKAAVETGVDLVGNTFFDVGSLGATAISELPTFLRGFANEEDANRFRDLKRQRRDQLPSYTPSQTTSEIQDELIKPLASKAREGWDMFAEANPNASESIADYFTDPRVQHTLEASIFATPSFARFGRAFKDANFAENMSRTTGGGNQKGMVLLHGSPHRFAPEVKVVRDNKEQWVLKSEQLPTDKVLETAPMGRKRLDKMGTGEGAQVRGWGSYDAQNPKVMANYRDMRPKKQYPPISYGNRDSDLYLNGNRVVESMMAENPELHAAHRAYLLSDKDLKKAKQRLKDDIEQYRYSSQFGMDQANGLFAMKQYTRNKKALELLESGDLGEMPQPKTTPTGYEVDIPDEKIATYMDQDTQLKDQPEIIDKLIAGFDKPYTDVWGNYDSDIEKIVYGRQGGLDYDLSNPDEKKLRDKILRQDLGEMHGYEVYRSLERGIDRGGIEPDLPEYEFEALAPDQAASLALRDADIGGMKFLDAYSRRSNMPDEERTRNFISFEDEPSKILSRNNMFAQTPVDESMFGTKLDGSPQSSIFGGKQKGMIDLFGRGTGGNGNNSTDMAAYLLMLQGARQEGMPNLPAYQNTSIFQDKVGKGRKERIDDLGLRHPIGGGKKLTTPPDELSRIIMPSGQGIPRRTMDIEELQGKSIFPLFGDRSQAGVDLWGINGNIFGDPVHLGGGYEFMNYNPNQMWASHGSKIKKLWNRAASAYDRGKEPYGIFMPQSHDSLRFNDMTLNTMLHGIKAADASPQVMSQFDADIRKTRPEWTSLDDPEMQKLMDNVGAVRKEVVRVAGLDKYQKEGFPSLADSMFAITDPDLMDTPIFHGGQAIGKPDMRTSTSGHGTYNTNMGGNYVGGLEQAIPPELLFPDWYKWKMSQPNANYETFKTSLYRGEPVQDVNQKLIDDINAYLGK